MKEAQKKAAVEKRRQELEEQRRKAREEQRKRDEEKKRRFMEQEQRKQDLMAKAKAGKIQHDQDSALMKKLNKSSLSHWLPAHVNAKNFALVCVHACAERGVKERRWRVMVAHLRALSF